MPAIDLAEYIPYWDTINSNIFLFSLTTAVVLPFVVILIGYGIHLSGWRWHSWWVFLSIPGLFMP